MATFDINVTGDLTDEEFHEMQGLNLPDEVDDDSSAIPGDLLPPLGLEGKSDEYKDWRDTKYLGSVKS